MLDQVRTCSCSAWNCALGGKLFKCVHFALKLAEYLLCMARLRLQRHDLLAACGLHLLDLLRGTLVGPRPEVAAERHQPLDCRVGEDDLRTPLTLGFFPDIDVELDGGVAAAHDWPNTWCSRTELGCR